MQTYVYIIKTLQSLHQVHFIVLLTILLKHQTHKFVQKEREISIYLLL